MKFRLVLLFVFTLFTCVIFSQNDTNKVKELQKKAEVFYAANQLDSIQFYENKALEISTNINYKSGAAKALSSLGLVYKMKGNYPKALEAFFQSLAAFEKLGNQLGVVTNLGNIGTVYDTQGDLPKALNYYFKALKISETIPDKHVISTQYRNIATIYSEQNQVAKAEEYHFKALAIDKLLNDKKNIATTLINLGTLYSYNDSLTKSLNYYLEALTLLKEINLKQEIATCLLNISATYTDLKENKKAEDYLQQTFVLSEQIDDNEFKSTLEKVASQVYTEFGKDKLAFMHYKKYISLRDSIYNEENTKRSVKAELNYEFEKKQATVKFENDKLVYQFEADKKLNKQLRIFFILIIVLAIVLLYFAKRAYDNKKKVADFMAAESNRKEILLQEVHHRINNNLQIISSLLSLQANSANDEKLEAYLKQSQNRIQSLSVLHELLYQNDSVLQININEYLTKVLDYHRDILNTLPLKVQLETDIASVNFSTKIAVPLALIVNELITNSIKYAFTDIDTGKILISLLPVTNELHTWKLTVRDTGKGLPAETEFRKDSLGLRLVTIMSKQIKGILTKHNYAGATFEVVFKLEL
jgi:two-component sensor histidine kinase